MPASPSGGTREWSWRRTRCRRRGAGGRPWRRRRSLADDPGASLGGPHRLPQGPRRRAGHRRRRGPRGRGGGAPGASRRVGSDAGTGAGPRRACRPEAGPCGSGAERRREASEAERRVDCRDTDNGTAVLGGVHLPAGPAIAADDRLHAIARAIKAGGDPRTLDQLSADVFLSLLLGVQPAAMTSATISGADAVRARVGGDMLAGRSAEDSISGDGDRPDVRMPLAVAAMARTVGNRIGAVHLTVPLPTLLGLSAEQGEASGYGPLTAEVARQMAGAASDSRTRWCVTVTDANGEPLHHGHLGYRPPPEMAHVIRTLQPTCVFPGCGRPASACDLDHRVPYDRGGATCPCNVSPLCRRHHRTKQADGWRLTEHDACLRWTTPAGRTYELSPYLLKGETPPPIMTERRSTGPPILSDTVAGSFVEDRWRKRIPGPRRLGRTGPGFTSCVVAAENQPRPGPRADRPGPVPLRREPHVRPSSWPGRNPRGSGAGHRSVGSLTRPPGTRPSRSAMDAR